MCCRKAETKKRDIRGDRKKPWVLTSRVEKRVYGYQDPNGTYVLLKWSIDLSEIVWRLRHVRDSSKLTRIADWSHCGLESWTFSAQLCSWRRSVTVYKPCSLIRHRHDPFYL